MKLYHATFNTRVPSILKTGLGGPKAAQHPNWVYSKDRPNYVCFAVDPDQAEDFLENSTEQLVSQDDYESGYTIFEIDTETNLYFGKFILDPNVLLDDGEEPYSYAYLGVIPPQYLKIYRKGVL